ncbi:(d)CMP kinase [Anaerotignum sp.]
MKRFAIAVDGPAGSGKSTVAKMVARKLGIIYVDTGAMYRTVALHCTQENIPLEEEAAVVASLDGLNMRIQPDTEGQRIFLNEEDVTAKIRTAEIGKGASVVAAYQKVRERMVELQQEMAREQSVIMDGRDIGTVVLPHAEVKIYLDADAGERARRRVGELEAKGETADFEEIKKMIIQRDYNDMHREHSPLKKAEDAISLDSTGMSIEEVLQAILDITAERVKEE